MKWICGLLVMALAISAQPLVLAAQEPPAAKTDGPAAEPPKTDAKPAETTPPATTEPPKTEPAKADAPKTETPAAETPKADTTKSDATAKADAKPADQTPPVACTVKSATGTVQWRLSDKEPWQPIKVGQDLVLGTDICTGFRATCLLMFKDESSAVKVQPMTVLRIGEFEQNGNKVRTRLYVQRGTTETIVEKSRFESDFAIVTSEVTLAVTGTKVIRFRQSHDMGFTVNLSQSGGINLTQHNNQRSRDLRPNDTVGSGLGLAIQNVNFGSRVPVFDMHGGLTQHEQFTLLNRPGMFFGPPNLNAPNGGAGPLGNPRQQNIQQNNPFVQQYQQEQGIIHEWECEG